MRSRSAFSFSYPSRVTGMRSVITTAPEKGMRAGRREPPEVCEKKRKPQPALFFPGRCGHKVPTQARRLVYFFLSAWTGDNDSGAKGRPSAGEPQATPS